LHSDAAFGMHMNETRKSKCPFCRQVLGFEEEDYKKLFLAKQFCEQWDDKLDHLRSQFRKYTRKLQCLNGWIGKMRRLKNQLECKLKAENKL